MSAIYDNWERLVAAVVKKQQLWELFHDYSRSPSTLSEASEFSSSFDSRCPFDDLASDFSRLGSSSTYRRTPKMVFFSDFSPAIDFKDVCLASSELLGSGTFGSSYAATMDNGVRIVVKKLKSTSVSETEFNRHMTIVGGVKHENVAALRAYYASEDERLMLYDYQTRGSVCALLHGRNGERQARVDWGIRLRIAVGAARGIAEIHKLNNGKLAHGNIKASNVFRNPDEYGCVSDLGPTNFTTTRAFTPAAYCYAPEVENSKSVSQASDVYSFGVLLLELLTRKSTAHVPGGPEAIDLVKLVTSVRDRASCMEVFDADLLKLPSIRVQIVKMLHIGLRCIETSRTKRPKMSEVAKTLEEISVLNPISRVPVERNFVFFEDANPTFDLKDVVKASAELLGKGTFGICFKARLGNGSEIVVKRLSGVTVTFEEFRDHMEVVGRTRHRNIAGVRAYYFSKDEKLLVYDYYNQGSVASFLHGKKGNNNRAHLDWETRQKIVLGAAKGIARIHAQDNGNFVHGNIKSSNIFLSRQKHGIVSDAGLVKLVDPIRRRTPGHCAPEDTDTGSVSQASDIYSFGVLVLELLSGKPSQITTDDGKIISLVNWIQSVARVDWTSKVFDSDFSRHGIMEETTMLQLLRIAMDCVELSPERRPCMSQVVKMLEEIGVVEPQNEISEESRLEYLLDDLLPTLHHK